MKNNQDCKMEELTSVDVESLSIYEIKELLRSGDQKLISDITGYVPDYVRMVLDETRNNELIIEVARLILSNRQMVIELGDELKKEYELKRLQKKI